MRVIGGSARGRVLQAPRGRNVRPTLDRVREALFQILGDRVTGAAFLDGFAGTGAVGIEALSRGAARAVFVERDPALVRAIRVNLERTGFTRRATVAAGDWRRSFAVLVRRDEMFDLIFLDPPYDSPDRDAAIARVARSSLLAPDGLLIVEEPARHPDRPDGDELRRTRASRYGDTRLAFYRRAACGDDR